ncbi:MAG: flagellar brake protein [Desulfovibrio sp.]|nr:MAG: flagellar brake protein [Desulfovibrio sp.]
MKIDPNAVEFKKSDELNLELGANVLVEPYGGAGLQFRTEFVGMFKGRYVAVRLPVTRKILDALPSNRLVNLRFLQTGGVVCGFQAEVAHIMVRPFPILFVDYPESIEVFHLRKHDRVMCYLPVALFMDGEEVKGVITDISTGGCRVFLDDGAVSGLPKTEKDAELSCLFTLSDSNMEVLVNGVIRTVEDQKQGVVLGLGFIEPTEEVVEAVGQYVAVVKEHLGE